MTSPAQTVRIFGGYLIAMAASSAAIYWFKHKRSQA